MSVYVCVHLYVYIPLYVRIYHIFVYFIMSVCICMCEYVYIYVYIYIYTCSYAFEVMDNIPDVDYEGILSKEAEKNLLATVLEAMDVCIYTL